MNEMEIHRNSLSAWQSLSTTAGLETFGRDKDLLEQLKHRINPAAESLESALANTPVAQFVTAFLATIQPFAQMFRDVLTFFEKAGARYGQRQWRVCIGEEIAELKNFEEFVEKWDSIEFDLDVPALDQKNAFILNSVRLEHGSSSYLTSCTTGQGVPTFPKDVDEWLACYDSGEYKLLPDSIAPKNFPTGLDDAARVVQAALYVICQRNLSRGALIEEHKKRHYKTDVSDAFHPWTIAQSETDFWLRSSVVYLANLLLEDEKTKLDFGRELSTFYSSMGRRHFSTKIEFKDLERILSLPAWKRRYEFYGVWVATEIIDSLSDHKVSINHNNGVLRFAFKETLLADINSSSPKLSLYSERRSPLQNPIGKSRKNSVQPDYSVWTRNNGKPSCVLVVEVKHYKKESRKNFGDALSDYAQAHPNAKVVLVNYGPTEGDYSTLGGIEKARTVALGNFNPTEPLVKSVFRQLVRSAVGDPIIDSDTDTASDLPDTAPYLGEAVAIDVSRYMLEDLKFPWWNWKSLGLPESDDMNLFLIDNRIRAFIKQSNFRHWLESEKLNEPVWVHDPINVLLNSYQTLTFVSNRSGIGCLAAVPNATFKILDSHPFIFTIRIERIK